MGAGFRGHGADVFEEKKVAYGIALNLPSGFGRAHIFLAATTPPAQKSIVPPGVV
jgi:hypothetical protein